MMAERMKSIDGLKGFCGIWVCIVHYILAFLPWGFIGWGSGIPDSEKYTYYFDNFPFSILSNGSFPLYIFFSLIAFIPAFRYFKTHDEGPIKRQAVRRYFRLMPPVLACVIFSYLVYAFGGMYNQELAIDVNSNWNKAFYTADLSFFGAIINGIFSSFIYGNSDYCSVLWCLNVIFIGSYISYAIILLFGDAKNRWIIYTILLALSYLSPNYASFITGIAIADILTHSANLKKPTFFGEILLIIGIFIGNFPSVLLPTVELLYISYAIGSLFVIWGCIESHFIKELLSAKWLVIAGKLSFALILVHFTILFSLSAWIFHFLLGNGYSFWISILISWGISTPVIYIVAFLFEKYIEQPTEKLLNWTSSKFL